MRPVHPGARDRLTKELRCGLCGKLLAEKAERGTVIICRLVLVQLFSWIDGRATAQKLLEVTEHWDFYETNEIMKDAHEAEMGKVDLSRVAVIHMDES
jgi:hypothetical protein